ncbi:MAG: glutathione S-transferase family protein [Burkholderiales bacterium]|nr:glutathione S-transferase family protein [Burkholderiales bacterium]
MLKLYYFPGTCALASHIALEEAGAGYEAVRVDFKQNEQRSAAYLAINPKGRVPALATEHGILTETPAILAYVAQRFPAARLAPADPFAFARAQSFNSYLCSTVHVAHAHKGRGARWSDDPAVIEGMKQKVTRNMADCFAYIEADLIAGPWVMGEDYGICDAYLFTIARWLDGDGVDVAAYPKVQAHMQRMAARAAVARVLALHQG